MVGFHWDVEQILDEPHLDVVSGMIDIDPSSKNVFEGVERRGMCDVANVLRIKSETRLVLVPFVTVIGFLVSFFRFEKFF